MNNHQAFRIFRAGLSICSLLVAGCAGIGAQPHPAYQPHRVSGVPTYRNTGEVGNVVFSQESLPRDQKTYSNLIDTIEIARGTVRTIYARGFFPCNMREALAYVTKNQSTAASFQLQTNLKLAKGSEVLETGVARNPVSGVWLDRATAGTDTTGEIDKKVPTLRAGEYTLFVENYVTYDYVENKLTGKRAPANVLLADGKLRVIVK